MPVVYACGFVYKDSYVVYACGFVCKDSYVVYACGFVCKDSYVCGFVYKDSYVFYDCGFVCKDCNIMTGLWCVGTMRHLLAQTLREAAMKLGWNTTRMWGGMYVYFKLSLDVITSPLLA